MSAGRSPPDGGLGFAGAIELADLAEQNFGDRQGLAYEELQVSRAGDFHRFWHAPARETPPGGESFVAVIERVSQAVHRLVESHAGRDIIAVVHGGTIRAALAMALGLDPEAPLAFAIENCSITSIDRVDGPGIGPGWRVVTVNRPPR
jgi:alpha-ribazole phosphatase